MATPSDIIGRHTAGRALPKSFIEIPNSVSGYEGKGILVNIDAIMAVHDNNPGCLILLRSSNAQINTPLDYAVVVSLIKEAQQQQG